MIPGLGTVVNVAAVLIGSVIGVLLGNRLPVRTRDVVTDSLGLVTLLIAGTSAMAVLDDDLSDFVGDSAPMLIVLGALLIGGIAGSLLRLESRVESLGGWLQNRLAGGVSSADRHRFIEGFVVSSLIFCTGPLTILGSINDGLGNGADQLFLKSALDGFAAITATGGLLLVGVALRLLRVREIPVADLLPALLVAPVLVSFVGALH